MKKISITSAAFGAVLHLLGCEGKYLLPRNANVETFLQGREEMCRNGWAQLDFDGSLLPEAPFARLLYDISHACAVLRLESGESTCWMVRAPTEMLYIERQGDVFVLERRKGVTFMPWVREVLLPAAEGRLTTQGPDGKKKTASLAAYAPGSRGRAEELAKHLAMFFGKKN